jgi:hypothetical protein
VGAEEGRLVTAPVWNSVNALTGDVVEPPNAFWAAHAAADDLLAELESLRRERADRDELEQELREARETITDLRRALKAVRS